MVISNLNEAVFTSQPVLDGKEIRYVYYTEVEDGLWYWEFEHDERTGESLVRIVSLGEILELAPNLLQVLEKMGYGQMAYLDGGIWLIKDYQEEA